MNENFKQTIEGHLTLTCSVFVNVMNSHETMSVNMYCQSLLKCLNSLRDKKHSNL